jgi:hypothetical protein
MVALTASQKKKLKLHAVNQSARHMKTMIALMKEGESFSEAHKEASKKKVAQKQSQKQSQKVVINLAAPRRRRRVAPRQSARPNSGRVLNQFVQPESMLPQRTIFPTSIPQQLIGNAVRSPVLTNEVAPRPPAVEVGAVVGRAELPTRPPLTPAQAQSVRKARAVASRISMEMSEAAERAAEARAAAKLFMSQNPIQRDRFGLIPPSREDQPTPLVPSTPLMRATSNTSSRNTTAPPSPYRDPYAGSNDPFSN